MAETVFDIFGEHLTRHSVKNVARHPLSNNENMGKAVLSSSIKPNALSGPIKPNALPGPVKPNEPVKNKGETKKSFLSNTGKALQSTPVRNVFTPRALNVGSMIYTDERGDKEWKIEDFEFTRPSYNYDNYNKDMFDYLPFPEPEIVQQLSPSNTPPPVIKRPSMEFDLSYNYDFLTDDFTNESISDEDLGLPEFY